MQKNTSVTLGKYFDDFITEQVKVGRYGSASEAIRAGLRLLEEQENKLAILRQSIEEGENSGIADYNYHDFIKTLKQ